MSLEYESSSVLGFESAGGGEKVGDHVWAVPPRYKFSRLLGTGAYGTVAEFYDCRKRVHVAIKRVGEVFRDTLDAKRILRELKVLRHLRKCKYVNMIRDILPPPSTEFEEIYMVLECADMDLHKLIYSDRRYGDNHCKYIFYDMLKAFAVLHRAGIVHRDVKPSNLLINTNDCSVKLCDFGLARNAVLNLSSPPTPQLAEPFTWLPTNLSTDRRCTTSSTTASDDTPRTPRVEKCVLDAPLTEYVITRWYRPPEVLLNSGSYGKEVDMWGLGCVFAEVVQRKAMFPGRDNVDQVGKICAVIGKPKDFKSLYTTDPRSLSRETRKARVHIEKIPELASPGLSPVLSSASPLLVDLISKLLVFEPSNRLTAEQALEHEYFLDLRASDVGCDGESLLEKELAAVSVMDWDFDHVPLLKKSIQKKIYEEIIEHYHPEIIPRDIAKITATRINVPEKSWQPVDSCRGDHLAINMSRLAATSPVSNRSPSLDPWPIGSSSQGSPLRWGQRRNTASFTTSQTDTCVISVNAAARRNTRPYKKQRIRP